MNDVIELRPRLRPLPQPADNSIAARNHAPAVTLSPRLIAFAGAAGAGKSTAAAVLIERGFVRIRFAGPLKDMLHALGLSWDEIDGARKEEPCAKLGGCTPRRAMQTLGTEWGRDLIAPDLWILAWSRSARAALNDGKSVVVDDCRFLNEASAVWGLGGEIVKVVGRSGGLAATHASEQHSLICDGTISNSGSVEALRSQVGGLL